MNYYIIPLFTRIFVFPRKSRFLSFMTALCFITIIIVTMVLTLTITIQNSFHNLLYKQLQGLNTDLIISRTHAKPFSQKQLNLLNSIPYIASWAPVCHEYALLKRKDASSHFPISVRIVHPTRESQTSSIKNYVLSKKPLSELLKDNQILIGKGLFKRMHIKIGTPLDIVTFTIQQSWWGKSRVATNTKEIIISGVIKTDIEEFDETTIICSYDFAKTLFDEIEIETISVKLSKDGTAEQVRKKLTEKEPALQVRTWKEIKPSLNAALSLEGYVTYLYLFLLLLLTLIIIGSLFLLQLSNNRAKIMLLHMLGARTGTLYLFSIGSLLLQTICASILGLILSFGIGMYIKAHTPMTIKKAYHVAHLPLIFSKTLFLQIMALMMSITLITTIVMFILFSYTKKFNCVRQEW